jgi:hypothetical protein
MSRGSRLPINPPKHTKAYKLQASFQQIHGLPQIKGTAAMGLAGRSLRVPQHDDVRVTSEEHLADKPVLVHRQRLLLALASLGDL